jgi:hypothetical protein
LPRTPALTNLPLHGFDHNRTWWAVVKLAVELTAWFQLLVPTAATPAAGNPDGCARGRAIRLFVRFSYAPAASLMRIFRSSNDLRNPARNNIEHSKGGAPLGYRPIARLVPATFEGWMTRTAAEGESKTLRSHLSSL